MSKSNIKLSVAGDKYYLEIYEAEPGKLVFEMHANDHDDSYGGIVEIDTKDFLELLQRLVSK